MKEIVFDFFFALMIVAAIAAVAGLLTRSDRADTGPQDGNTVSCAASENGAALERPAGTRGRG